MDVVVETYFVYFVPEKDDRDYLGVEESAKGLNPDKLSWTEPLVDDDIVVQ